MNSTAKTPPAHGDIPICPGCNAAPATRSRLPNRGEDQVPIEDLPWGLCDSCSDDAYGGATSLAEDLAREVIRLRHRIRELTNDGRCGKDR